MLIDFITRWKCAPVRGDPKEKEDPLTKHAYYIATVTVTSDRTIMERQEEEEEEGKWVKALDIKKGEKGGPESCLLTATASGNKVFGRSLAKIIALMCSNRVQLSHSAIPF